MLSAWTGKLVHMTRLLIALGFAAVLAVAPAAAKAKARTLVGCVQTHQGQYTLATKSQKGKPREYTLGGTHDFAKDVGHRVRVVGSLAKRALTASSVQTIATNCR